MPTKEEIEAYEEKHGEPHPVFTIDHRPERITFTGTEPAITFINPDKQIPTLSSRD